MNKARLWLAISLLPLDYFSLLASLVGAYYLRLHWTLTPVITIEPLGSYLLPGAIAALAALLIFACLGLYQLRTLNSPELFLRLVGAVMLWVAGIIIVLFVFKTTFFSRLVMGLTFVLAITLTFVLRLIFNQLKVWLASQNIGLERVLLIAPDSTVADSLSKFFKANPAWLMRIVKRTSAHDLESVKSLVESSQITSLMLAESVNESLLADYFAFAEKNNLRLRYFPTFANLLATHVVGTTVAGYPLLELRSTPLEGWGRAAKRLIDFILAAIALVVLSPVFALVALAVRLNSPGPVIFRQTRIGERGQEFIFYKFRSMYTNLSTGEGFGGAEAEALREKLKAKNEGKGLLFKLKNDPRVTRVGKFIRSTSLDELPQLFNVLKGDMSLVGPRPALPDEVAQYTDEIRRRLLVKPGITGLWQVSGRSDAEFEEYLTLDVYYIERWSLWLDFWILLKTVWVLLNRKGSY
jgi:exopolysaccharide biosynthesis polyprenyl glycosylphosphotransferase